MSFLTQAYLMEKYGHRLNPVELAEVLGIAPGTVRNKIAARRLGIRTYLDLGHRFADVRDVAAYPDEVPHEPENEE